MRHKPNKLALWPTPISVVNRILPRIGNAFAVNTAWSHLCAVFRANSENFIHLQNIKIHATVAIHLFRIAPATLENEIWGKI